MEFRLLGPFEVRVDATPQPLAGRGEHDGEGALRTGNEGVPGGSEETDGGAAGTGARGEKC